MLSDDFKLQYNATILPQVMGRYRSGKSKRLIPARLKPRQRHIVHLPLQIKLDVPSVRMRGLNVHRPIR